VGRYHFEVESLLEVPMSSKLLLVTPTGVEGKPILTKSLPEKSARAGALEIMAENTLCSMATITRSNRAHINTAYFCYSRDFELYFWSHPDSLHSRNLKWNPSMAVAIFSSSQTWQEPDKGLQLFGICRIASGRQARKAEKLYAKRFRYYASWKASLKPADSASHYRFFRFAVNRLKLFDERKFGEAVFVSAAVKRNRGKDLVQR